MIDFHCHIDLYPQPADIIRECEARSISILSVTTTPTAWSGTSTLAASTKFIRTALGLHPQIAHVRKGELDVFNRILPTTQYVGEIGLDGGPEFKNHWDDQLKVFRHILTACQRAGGRIMSIHSRRAATAVLDLLGEYLKAGIPILHWYSGSYEDLRRAIALGCWFSVGPAMLGGAKGAALVSRIPRDRILTETDGPFARIDGRSALPWDVKRADSELAKIWGCTDKEVQGIVHENLQRLLKSLL